MRSNKRALTACLVGLVAVVAVGLSASFAGAGRPDRLTNVEGTIWVANRGAHTIQGFEADTGEVVATMPMAASSQPGDLAFARGKLYVAEEFGASPGIAVVDLRLGRHLENPDRAQTARGFCTTTPRAREPQRQARRVRPVWNGHGRGRGHAHRHPARPLGHQPRDHERPCARRGLLAERTDPLRRQRRLERDHRARSAAPARCSGEWLCPARTSSPSHGTERPRM